MKQLINSICGIAGNSILMRISGAEIRDEVSAWVTLIGSIAITVTTIGIQIYRLIHDLDKDKKNNKPADAEKTQGERQR